MTTYDTGGRTSLRSKHNRSVLRIKMYHHMIDQQNMHGSISKHRRQLWDDSPEAVGLPFVWLGVQTRFAEVATGPWSRGTNRKVCPLWAVMGCYLFMDCDRRVIEGGTIQGTWDTWYLQ